MFRKNHKHKQPGLFGFQNVIKDSMRREIMDSEEFKFYELIFCRIREEDFAPLYSDKESRPNSPVNSMVSALLLQHRNRWTFAELHKNIKFNLLTKTALGLGELDESPFSEATLFNFINRLTDYHIDTGINLLEKVFDHLTAGQLEELQLSTAIQRTDSFQAASNLRKYGRLQFLVEVLNRVYRGLIEEDRRRYNDLFSEYVVKTSGQYVYRLKSEDMPSRLTSIAHVYRRIKEEIIGRYEPGDIHRIFNRVYTEQFIVDGEEIRLREDGLKTSFLLSPDDEDATFRRKRNTEYIGHVVNIVETCDPKNRVNLITDVAVYPNNVDDSTVMAQRLDPVKEKTPGLEELHLDGAYPAQRSDEKFEEQGVRIVQSGIRQKPPKWIQPEIDRNEQGIYTVTCPGQSAEATKSKKRYVAEFDGKVCESCPFADRCKVQKGKGVRRYYFKKTQYLMQVRHRAKNELPEERRNLRSNIEATVAEFSRGMRKGKLRVRGRFRATVFSFCTAAMINFGRVYRYLRSETPEPALN